jgi:hypothetical protein
MVDSLADIRMQLGVVAQDLDPQQSYTTWGGERSSTV